MLDMDPDLQSMHHEAQQRRARRHIDGIDDLRAAQKAESRNLTQREIAELLETSQAKVHRMLKMIERRGGSLEREPEEIILRAFAYDTDREELLEELIRFPYTYGEDAPYPHEGRISGTWDQVVRAVAKGLLSADEFTMLRHSIAK